MLYKTYKMEDVNTVTKFEIDNKTLYIKVMWKPNTNNLFQIKIYDADESWSGEFSCEAAQDYKDIFDENEDQYYKNVKKSLSKDHEFSYSFIKKSDGNSAEFTWKKVFEDQQAVLKHGSVLVIRDGVAESKDLLIDNLLSEIEKLKQNIDKLNARNKDLTLDLNKCKNCLEEYRDMKTSLETSLYGKFVQVLTAKKRRIQLLEDNLLKISKSNQPGNEMD